MEGKYLRRSPSNRGFHHGKPDNIYVGRSRTIPPAVPDVPPDELILTPDLLSAESDSVTFSVRSSPVPFGRSSGNQPAIQTTLQSPYNFFLEKPPPEYYRSGDSPVSPGVTVLLSPTAYGDDDSDAECMDFFQAATYSGPRTLQITAEKVRTAPQPVNVTRKAPKIGLPSPKTPKAWASIVEPDISTLPSKNVNVQRDVLEASTKLMGEVHRPKHRAEPTRERVPTTVSQPCQAVEAPRMMLSQPPRRTPSPKISHDKKPSDSWKRRSLSFDDHVQAQVLLLRQQSRSPSNDSQRSSRSNSSERGSSRGYVRAQPPSVLSRTISRTPSPVFDYDSGTDFESITDFEDDEDSCVEDNVQPEAFYKEAHSREETKWKSPYQQERAFESQSKLSTHSQSSRKISKPTTHLPVNGLPTSPKSSFRTNTYTQGHSGRQISSESKNFPPSSVVPPPRRASPPTIPIHQDEVNTYGASFAPSESRTPRTLVSNWLAGISLHAGRSEPPREHEATRSSRKPRIWGRKARPKPDETWI